MQTSTSPKFLHLHDLGLSLQDSGRQQLTRQTLIRRGRLFAETNGLRIFHLGKDAFVSAAEVDRLHNGEVAA